MDTSSETSNALDVNQAAAAFAGILEPQSVDEPKKEDAEAPAKAQPEPEEKTDNAEQVEVDPDQSDETVTIEVDGKPVELKKSELADYYKNGLRQSDYTKKTMETAEQRKAAEAEKSKALQERQQYAQGLQQVQTVLQAQLHESSQIDWQKLLETDPVEYLKRQHLVQARQAKLNQVQQEQQHLYARHQAEQSQAMRAFLETQQQELLAKLPDWKDDAKAKAERDSIKSYLMSEGFSESDVNNVMDHRAVILSRKAMLYDQMMSKAQAAAKKVQNLPQKVERTGGGEVKATDGRTAAMKQLQRTGRVEDAARVFANLL